MSSVSLKIFPGDTDKQWRLRTPAAGLPISPALFFLTLFLTLIALKPHCFLLATSKLIPIPGPLHLLYLLPGMVFLLPSGSWLLLVTVGLAYIGSHACSPSSPDKSTLLQVFWHILFLPPFVLDHLGITLFGFATWKYLCLCRCIPYSISKCFLSDERSLHACVLSHFSRVWLFATIWTVIRQAPQSIGFSRQDTSGLPCPPPGNLPDPGMEPVSSASFALQVASSLPSHWGSPDLRHT